MKQIYHAKRKIGGKFTNPCLFRQRHCRQRPRRPSLLPYSPHRDHPPMTDLHRTQVPEKWETKEDIGFDLIALHHRVASKVFLTTPTRLHLCAGIFVWLWMIENSLRFTFLNLKVMYIGSKSNPAILQTIPSLSRMMVVFGDFSFNTNDWKYSTLHFCLSQFSF